MVSYFLGDFKLDGSEVKPSQMVSGGDLNPKPSTPDHRFAHAEFSSPVAQVDERRSIFQPSSLVFHSEVYPGGWLRALPRDGFEGHRSISCWVP